MSRVSISCMAHGARASVFVDVRRVQSLLRTGTHLSRGLGCRSYTGMYVCVEVTSLCIYGILLCIYISRSLVQKQKQLLSHDSSDTLLLSHGAPPPDGTLECASLSLARTFSLSLSLLDPWEGVGRLASRVELWRCNATTRRKRAHACRWEIRSPSCGVATPQLGESTIPECEVWRCTKFCAPTIRPDFSRQKACRRTGLPEPRPRVPRSRSLLCASHTITRVQNCLLYTSPSPRDS